MARYHFDIETNGLYWEVTVLHSLVLRDMDTGVVTNCTDKMGFTPIDVGLQMMAEATEVCGHNIIMYDLPVLRKLYPDWDIKADCKVTDTLILVRVIWPHILTIDLAKRAKGSYNLGNQLGSHGLEAWGVRIGNWKGDYSKVKVEEFKKLHPKKKLAELKAMVWLEWTPEMQDYCVQDVAVTADLYERITRMGLAHQSWELEHAFALLIARQHFHGFYFDVHGAADLYAKLSQRREELRHELLQQFPTRRVEEVFIPKANNSKLGYVKGEPFTKVKYVKFNPSSRRHIAERLQEMGWEPDEYTKDGAVKVDETILLAIKDQYPAAALLIEHFLIDKRVGQIAEGQQAWLALVRDGRIHGSVNTNGANTGRCTHSKPNVTQVPGVGAPFGEECRSFFGPAPGMVQVGADASGIELRCLGHFLSRFDGGEFITTLLEGDIHWANVIALGLVETGTVRDEENDPYHKLYRGGAKTFIYGFLYGAGGKKLGEIIRDMIISCIQMDLPYDHLEKRFFSKHDMNTEAGLKAAGNKLKKTFVSRNPGIAKLSKAIDKKLADCRGAGKPMVLRGLDGRKLHVRASYTALNLLLQSAGALIVKQASVLADLKLSTRGYQWGADYAQMVHAHDEMQYSVRPEIAEEVGEVVLESFRKAGEVFKFTCPIDGEYKIGDNWKDCH